MANPQKENGYTGISNELLEELIKYKFPPKSSLPFRICLCVIRKTYGYHKKMDIISLSQFQKSLNEKNRSNLVYWLNFLVQAKILVKIKKGQNTIEYGFNKDYEQWLTPVQIRALVQARSYSSTSIDTKTSASNHTYKRNKENTKEIAEASSATFNWEEYLKILENDKRRDLQVIAFFFREKGIKFNSVDEARIAIKRHLRPAKDLSVFDDKKINFAINQAKSDKKLRDIFTIETLVKLLTK